MKQKLALSCALIHTPELLFLDEPTTGVDPVSRKEFWDILKDLRNQGITIVISTPYMDEASMCDNLLFLHRGEAVESGAPEDLIAAYPHQIYKITSSTGTISFPDASCRPDGILLMYPSTGNLHVVTGREQLTSEEIFSRVKEIVPEAEHIMEQKPSIEDLFFLLINRKEEQLNKNG